MWRTSLYCFLIVALGGGCTASRQHRPDYAVESLNAKDVMGGAWRVSTASSGDNENVGNLVGGIYRFHSHEWHGVFNHVDDPDTSTFFFYSVDYPMMCVVSMIQSGTTIPSMLVEVVQYQIESITAQELRLKRRDYSVRRYRPGEDEQEVFGDSEPVSLVLVRHRGAKR